MKSTLALSLLAAASLPALAKELVVFKEMCDASAATAIDGDHFLVADDEDNILRIYGRTGGAPKAQFDLNKFLGSEKKSHEADLEGAAKLGDLNFWIGSHGRNSKAKESPYRQTFFATRSVREGDAWEVKPVGKPYSHLLDDLLADGRLAKYGLKAAAELAPKTEGALNIEGLTGTPEGHLLIGFRNPLPEGKSIVVPLLNPKEVVDGARAKLGPPLELDLGGLGIRSLGYYKGRYLIIAGSFDDQRKPQLFEWTGGKDAPKPLAGVALAGLNPEGLTFRDGEKERYLLLSDDGTVPVDGKDCKKLKEPQLKSFRGTWLDL
jgi:hypothetical protein